MAKGIEEAIKNIKQKYSLEDKQESEEKWRFWDWMNEVYQLMCREYRQSLGLVKPLTYESKYWTESEDKYWAELHRVRGYKSDYRETWYEGQYVIREVIPDPPKQFEIEWAQKNNVKLRPTPPDEADTEERYQERLEAFGDRMMGRIK